MALLLLLFSTFMNLMYGIYFRRPAVFVHSFIDETGIFETALAFDDA